MADKMMRLAGRGADGRAKALKTNNEGILSVFSNSATEKITLNTSIAPQGVYTIEGIYFHGQSASINVITKSGDSERVPYKVEVYPQSESGSDLRMFFTLADGVLGRKILRMNTGDFSRARIILQNNSMNDSLSIEEIEIIHHPTASVIGTDYLTVREMISPEGFLEIDDLRFSDSSASIQIIPKAGAAESVPYELELFPLSITGSDMRSGFVITSQSTGRKTFNVCTKDFNRAKLRIGNISKSDHLDIEKVEVIHRSGCQEDNVKTFHIGEFSENIGANNFSEVIVSNNPFILQDATILIPNEFEKDVVISWDTGQVVRYMGARGGFATTRTLDKIAEEDPLFNVFSTTDRLGLTFAPQVPILSQLKVTVTNNSDDDVVVSYRFLGSNL